VSRSTKEMKDFLKTLTFFGAVTVCLEIPLYNNIKRRLLSFASLILFLKSFLKVETETKRYVSTVFCLCSLTEPPYVGAEGCRRSCGQATRPAETRPQDLAQDQKGGRPSSGGRAGCLQVTAS